MNKTRSFLSDKFAWIILILTILLGLYGFISSLATGAPDPRNHEIRFLQKNT